jgi:acetyl-CoA carboxylase carboxyltransferase component
VIQILAPLTGTVVSVCVADGDLVQLGQELVVIEAMKMHHAVTAPEAGRARVDGIAVGDLVSEGDALLVLEPASVGPTPERESTVDSDLARADLAEVLARHEIGLDASRPEAVARRHGTGMRTARENLADLCDPDSFVEYGALAIAAQQQRRSVEELIARTPADGMVTGLATINADQFGADRTGCVVMAYDYMVLAGTQGKRNHRKTDRMLDLAERHRLPVVLFAEGGGGRPGDTDTDMVSGLTTPTFHTIGRLSGLVPLIGVVAGRCFAGNAALLGCCDVIIATEGANIGMGGPAMVAGGGLGTFAPEEIGPVAEQFANGVVDLLVPSERDAALLARRYLSYFQGTSPRWTCADQATLRPLVPENRLRAYDVRSVVGALADAGSVLELRSGYGAGMVTALVRIEGVPMGLIANNPLHLGGAIDADAADKAARFLQLCDGHGLPVVSLCDTPGFMVGPAAEQTATVRHFSRLFVIGANLGVPVVTVVLRKAYGLGAQAMAGGTFTAPAATVAWPTGEVGPMGLEGAVSLGFRRELDAVADPAERVELERYLIERAYQHSKALNVASSFELDDVIDPADTRRWILAAIRGFDAAARPEAPRKRRPYIDTW